MRKFLLFLSLTGIPFAGFSQYQEAYLDPQGAVQVRPVEIPAALQESARTTNLAAVARLAQEI